MTPLINIYATYKLLVFGVDGTLADRDSGELLPGRREFFQRLALIAYPAKVDAPRIALASNQGGVGFRYWLETERPAFLFKNRPANTSQQQINNYPTQEQAENRIHRAARTIRQATRELRPFALPVRIYLSFAWQFESGGWAPRPAGTEGDHRWLQSWRKPGPGMLIQAIIDANAIRPEVLMVGDRSEDAEAAKAAGCAFVWAKDFFEEVSE